MKVKKTMKKSNPRLRFRLTSNFNHEKSAVSSLGLVEGNSTITVNTVGDTDESSTDKKGIDMITTTFNDTAKEVSASRKMYRVGFDWGEFGHISSKNNMFNAVNLFSK